MRFEPDQKLSNSGPKPTASVGFRNTTAAMLPVAPDNSVGAGKTPLVEEMTANALDGGRLAGSPYPCVRSYLCAGDSGEERIARG